MEMLERPASLIKRCLLIMLLAAGVETTAVHGDEPGFRRYAELDPSTRELVDRTVEAHGGDRIRQVRTVRYRGRVEGNDVTSPLEVLIQYPDSIRVRFATEGEFADMVTTPEMDYLRMPGMPGDAVLKLPGESLATLRRNLRFDLMSVLGHTTDPDYTFSYGGSEWRGGLLFDVLRIRSEDTDVAWLIDRRTGRIEELRIGEEVHRFADWREIDGLWFPFSTRVTEPSGDTVSRLDSVEVNVDTASVFQRPTTILLN